MADNISKLYNELKSTYDLGSEDDFRDYLKDANKREALRKELESEYEVGDSTSFSNYLGFGEVEQPKASASAPTDTVTATSQQAPQPEQQSWQPSEQDKIRMSAEINQGLNNFRKDTQARLDQVNRLAKSQTQEGRDLSRAQRTLAKSQGIETDPIGLLNPNTSNVATDNNAGEQSTPSVTPVKGATFYGMTVDEDGNKVPQWMMPDGSLTTSFSEADKSVTAARQERNRLANLTVSAQLRNAQKELDELNRKINERSEQNRKKQSNHPIYNGTRPGSFSQNYNYLGDEDIKQWSAAKRQVEERIEKLEKQQEESQGKSRGFWRGMGDVLSDFRTWDFGLSDIRDATSALQINNKIENGQELTDAEKDRMKAMAANQAIEENGTWLYRMGQMSGEMLPFMLDFAIMGGSKSGTTALSKALTGYLSKGAEKLMPEVAKKKAAQWAIKVFGTMPEDLLVRAPLMTNTVQAGKTASDIIDRRLGDVTVKEDGTYDFSKDKEWGSAIWQGEANNIIENYSEMFGTHLEAPVNKLAELAGKGLGKVFGAGRMTKILSTANASELGNIARTTRQFLQDNLGVSDYVGEVGEEYYGQLWRTMLNLDDAYKQNPDGTRTNLMLDPEFHGDIWGGMALSMGVLHGGTMALNYGGKKSSQAVNYMQLRHNVNKSDKLAATALTPDIWEGMKATIDGLDNEQMGEYADRIMNDPNMSEEARAAVMSYMESTLNLRGFNLGSMAQQRGVPVDVEEASMDESFMDGYSATDPQEMNDIQRTLDTRRQLLESSLSPDAISAIDENPIESLQQITEPELRQNVLDYINAKFVYDGMMQRINDDIDSEIAISDATVDSRTNKATGVVQPATMKGEERQVYIIDGNVVMFDDGSGVDIDKSDDSIIIRDAETGKLEFTNPSAILNISESIDPEQQKEEARQAIIQEKSQEADTKIEGKVDIIPGESYFVLTPEGEQKQMAVLWESKDDKGNLVEGMYDVEMPDGTITSLSTADIQNMISVANDKRIQDFEEERRSLPIESLENVPENADSGISNVQNVPENGLNDTENVPNPTENVPPGPENENIKEDTALSHIPINPETGEPILHHESVDADTAWDGAVEFMENEEDATLFIQGEKAKAESELKKAEKAYEKIKPDGGIAKFKKDREDARLAIEEAKANVERWKAMLEVPVRRQLELEAKQREEERLREEANRRLAEEARLRAEQEKLEREEAERIEREKLNGVPDWSQDTPQDARARGYRRDGAGMVERQKPLENAVVGNEVNVKFGDKEIPTGKVAVIEAENLQPSHLQGQRNPSFFIDEAQPKNRTDAASMDASRKIASNIRPEEVTSSITAYTGAPTVNSRGEVIQGNNRSDALRLMWDSYKDQGKKYKQYLIDHADEYGINPELIRGMNNPVLVNMLDVDDNEAIRLGQFGATDTESGGIERIKPKNTVQKMGASTKNFANILLRSTDDESSFSQLVDQNGIEALKWLSDRGFISPTQYKSAFDSKGNLTGEAANDLKGILYQTIFTGGSTQLEEMFNTMPAKAQRAILATAFRDHDSATDGKMLPEIQQSIMAFNMLMGYQPFMEAKNLEDAKRAAEEWKRSYAFDEVTGESILPSENFSNFAIELAARFKGHTQSHIQGLLNEMFDVIQGTKEDTLFEEADKTPKTLAEAIKIVLDMEYQPVKKNNDNGQNGSDNVAINGEDGKTGRFRSSGGTEGREQSKEGTEPTDSGRGTETDSREGLSSEETPTSPTIGEKIAEAEAEVNTEPTDKQKEAGNYKMGHVKIGKFDMTIENPKGSVRSGVDADGKAWSVTMQHTYGYIKGTKGVDGDHIDVYASSDIDGWNGEKVFVIDQYNPDGTFDEHKVMLGFNHKEEAYNAYLSNYEKDWEKGRRIDITEVSTPEFEKWIESSKRKTKPFAEYNTVKKDEAPKSSIETEQEDIFQQAERIAQEIQEKKKTLQETESQENRDEEAGSTAYEPRRSYGRRMARESGKSLFDWADEETIRNNPQENQEEIESADNANKAIEDYSEKFSDYLRRSEEIEAELAKNGLGEEERFALEQERDVIEEVILGEKERLTDSLRNFYVKNNTPEDAEMLSREMAARVQAEVSVRLNGKRLLDDLLTPAKEIASSGEPISGMKESEGDVKTAGGPISYMAKGHLPDAEKGEFSYVERQFLRSNNFSFTGRDKIRDRGDVAYIFRELENYSIENVFAVMQREDGSYKIVHIGMGTPTSSLADLGAIRGAYDAFGAQKIWLVHNHPSGKMSPSPADRDLMLKIETAFEDLNVETEGIIMDTRSGRYVSFHGEGMSEKFDRDFEMEEKPVEILAFDRMDRSNEPVEKEKLNQPYLVVNYISKMREGKEPRVSYLLLNNQMEVMGNFHTDYKEMGDPALAEEIASVGIKFGAKSIIPYGNVDINGVRALNEGVKNYSMEDLRIVDALQVREEGHQSAYDAGLMEPDVNYGKTEIEEINRRFNDDIERFSKGELKQGHRFELGMPSENLKAAGFPDLPITMRAGLLESKSKMGRHPFEASDLNNLVEAIQNPIAIFRYSKDNMRNMIVDIKRGDKHFLVGVTLNYKAGDIEVNSVSGLFPKDNIEWLKWIQDGKAISIGQKEKVLNLIDSLRTTNTAAFPEENLNLEKASKESEAENSVRINPAQAIGLDLDATTKIVERFENPKYGENKNEVRDSGASYGRIDLKDGDFTKKDAVTAAKYYEDMLKGSGYQFREETQDSILSLMALYKAIVGKKGFRMEDVPSYENAYQYENAMTSANKAQEHDYFVKFMEPLNKAIYALCGRNEEERISMTNYMMAKHGLERNEYMRNEAAKNKEKTDRDFAGLTALTNETDWKLAEQKAQDMVDDYESTHDTALIDELWSKTKAATEATLEKIWLSGLINEDTFNETKDMYEYYIPLRGWEETTSDEAYGYLTSKDGPLRGNVMKSAKGRGSKADDPIATIAMMAADAIRQGNRNVMKQRFLNFVWNNPSDLVSVNELWLAKNDVSGGWEPVFADINPKMRVKEVTEEIRKFEEKMERLMAAEPNKYKKGKDAVNIPYLVVNGNLKEHQVLVMRNGKTYVLTINGNPRAAQALNGMTNPDNAIEGPLGSALGLVQTITRELSANFTQRDPNFIVSNFIRDMIFSNTMVWVKENPRYALRFHKNVKKANPKVMAKLFAKWEKGKLDKTKPLEKQFMDFMLNGGETGYTVQKDIDGYKRTIAKELKAQGSVGRKAWRALILTCDVATRSVENTARFAAFLTSREMGRTLGRSIWDAKEISVNFNKKGSGGKFIKANGQTLIGKTGGFMTGFGRPFFAFWNAGVQGGANILRATWKNPIKAGMAASALYGFGVLIPFLNQVICQLISSLIGGGDGDDDKNPYYDLPEYVRRSNICLYAGGGKMDNYSVAD